MTEEISSSTQSSIKALVPLFQELNDLKRLRDAHTSGSVAQRLFVRAWTRWAHGEDLGRVALQETARALVATKLAGIDTSVLERGGLDESKRRTVFERAFDAVSEPLEQSSRADLRRAASDLACVQTCWRTSLEARQEPVGPATQIILCQALCRACHRLASANLRAGLRPH